MIHHNLNYYETMLPHNIQTILREDRRNIEELLLNINRKFPDININLYWELKQESYTEYSVTLTKYDSEHEEINECLSQILQKVYPAYIQLPYLSSLKSVLRA